MVIIQCLRSYGRSSGVASIRLDKMSQREYLIFFANTQGFKASESDLNPDIVTGSGTAATEASVRKGRLRRVAQGIPRTGSQKN